MRLRATQKGLAEYRAAGYQGELTAQLFSALKRVGLDEAHELIESWLIPEGDGRNGRCRSKPRVSVWCRAEALVWALFRRAHKKTRRY